MACASITDTATNIWNDLGQPTDISVSYIQTKLVSNSFLGKLNVLLGTCYTIVSGDIIPALGTDETAIYSALYQADFWTRKVAQLAAGLDPSPLSLADGDSRIVFTDVVNKMRLYRDMQKQLTDEVNRLATTYRIDGTSPGDVKYFTVDNGFFNNYGNGFIKDG